MKPITIREVKSINNYAKSIGERNNDGLLTDVKYRFFDDRNRAISADIKLWLKAESMTGRRSSIYRRIPGLAESVGVVGDFEFSS